MPDVAVALAVGGDCLADIAVPRGGPHAFGPVASDRTVSRTITPLAGNAPAGHGREQRGPRDGSHGLEGGGQHAPDNGSSAAAPLVIDRDAPLVTAHSNKEPARPTFKRGYGLRPL